MPVTLNDLRYLIVVLPTFLEIVGVRATSFAEEVEPRQIPLPG